MDVQMCVRERYSTIHAVADLGFEKGGFIYCARSAHCHRR